MSATFHEALSGLDDAALHGIFGPWDPMSADQIAGLLAGCGARWTIAGGRAARAGAPARRHEDTDVAIRVPELDVVRLVMRDWHLWEVTDGALRPLLAGVTVSPDCGQLWVRREARQPWRFEFLLDRLSTDSEWVYKRDTRVRLPWDRAVHTIGGVEYLRPEVALLFKAAKDRPKDRADLLAARLDPAGREWLADTLELLGHDEWARLTRLSDHPATADVDAGAAEVIDQD